MFIKWAYSRLRIHLAKVAFNITDAFRSLSAPGISIKLSLAGRIAVCVNENTLYALFDDSSFPSFDTAPSTQSNLDVIEYFMGAKYK